MSLLTTIALCCLAAAGVVLLRPAPRRRLVRRVPRPVRQRPNRRPAGLGGTRRVSSGQRPGRSLADLPARLVVGALVAMASVLFVGGWPGVAIGGMAAAATDRLMRRVEPAAARAERLRCAADLPLAADLLAAALRSGTPVDRAATAVAEALGGPLGDRLVRVGRALALGGEPPEAWEHLADVAGAARLRTAAVRSSASGGALAGALIRLADDLRADRAVTVEVAARRAGVLIVLPLGLCFLPAFVLAGLVPVIVAVLGDAL